MRILVYLLSLVLLFTSLVFARSPQSGNPAINTPHPGDVLQGAVTVTGSSDMTGFVSAELSFSYADDPTNTWFLIATQGKPVLDQMLATWDTSSITDGNYSLRLRVFLADGSTSDVLVPSLRVRNYTQVETPTPAPVPPQATPLPTITPTSTPFPTPTTLPHNQAVLAPVDVSFSIIYGGLAALLLFIIVGIYLWLRRNL